MSLETVDIYGYRCPGPLEDRDQWRIGRIANQNAIKASRHGVDHRQEAVNYSVEILMPQRWQHDEPNAVVLL